MDDLDPAELATTVIAQAHMIRRLEAELVAARREMARLLTQLEDLSSAMVPDRPTPAP